MKVSLITTVLNEEKNIIPFLDSIKKQTLRPEEVIIVDGGSTDNTLKLIQKSKVPLRPRSEASKSPLQGKQKSYSKVKIVQKIGANRSEGRNFAIKMATGDIIAVSDVGCVLDKDWLKKITEPFKEPMVGVVSGYYLPIAKTVFQKCVAPFVCVMPDYVERHKNEKNFEFLPSSRSIAFRKEVWKKAGGYPRKLNYCEDLVFDQKIKKDGYNFYFAPEAVIYWPQRKNLITFFKQIFNYAVGDGQVFFSGYQTHSKRIILLFLRYFFALFLLIFGTIFDIFIKTLLALIFIYLIREIIIKYHYINDRRAFLLIPIIKITADLATMMGTLSGLLKNVDL